MNHESASVKSTHGMATQTQIWEDVFIQLINNNNQLINTRLMTIFCPLVCVCVFGLISYC